jgi:FtsZ-binding cell division protein ZapB
MKKIKNNSKPNLLKKVFIKLCRIMGYEIIDQNTFFIPTLNKPINSTLSIQGEKSINLPLGEVKITRQVKSLDIIIRTCASVKMLTQNKDRIFQEEKIEYTLRSINSILKSVLKAQQIHQNINFNLFIVDHNSSKENLDKIENLIKQSNLHYKLLHLKVEEFKDKINPINQKNEKSTVNQISNMCNIYKSLELSKSSKDLIYFVEDDYIHENQSISEMIFAYERIASLIKKDLIMCPADYPFLYMKADNTKLFIGENYHWRQIDETLCTFLMSRQIIEKHWDKLTDMCEQEHYPFESPLHEIYKEEICISPVPSLSIHCTNINSAFGLSPNKDWKKLWEENKV